MELAMSWWQALLSLLTALGGWEFFKYILNRKANQRLTETQADSAEFKLLSEALEFAQGQLKEKEERFADQTAHVRKLQRELLEIERSKAEGEIDNLKQIANLELELAKVRCDDEECPFRRPPNAKTKPLPGMTKEQYHLNKSA